MQKNSIVDDTNTTNTAKHTIKHAAEHIAEHAAKYAILCAPTKDITSAARTSTKNLSSVARKLLNISMIGATPFNHLVQKSWKDLKIQIYSVTLQDINIALASKQHINPAKKLPSKYHNFLDVFSRKDANILPKYKLGYNHAIKFIESKTSTWCEGAECV